MSLNFEQLKQLMKAGPVTVWAVPRSKGSNLLIPSRGGNIPYTINLYNWGIDEESVHGPFSLKFHNNAFFDNYWEAWGNWLCVKDTFK